MREAFRAQQAWAEDLPPVQGAAPSQPRRTVLCWSSPDTRVLGLRAPCHTFSVTATQLTPSTLQEQGALLPSEADPSTGSIPASDTW